MRDERAPTAVAPPSLLERLRRWPLAAAFLVAAYALLWHKSWTVDGCLHTLDADHFMDHRTYPHLLLRPVCFLWVSIWKQAGYTTHAQWHGALQLLFAGFGVAALTMLFAIARRRGGELAAWIGLIIVAFSRNAMRQIASFDEKPLGMAMFALALTATDRLVRKAGESPATQFRSVLPAAAAWALALFGHLQNIAFAVPFVLMLVLWRAGPANPLGRRLGLAARAVLVMALTGLVLFIALHWHIGGFAAIPQFVHTLWMERPGPPAPASPIHLWVGAVEGWIKAYFLVNRLSPRALLWLAAAGFGLLALAVARGFARRRDALGGMLLGGCLLLMVMMPLANSFPQFGDSYTLLVFAAFVLMVTASWRLLLAGAAVVLGVNLPPTVSLAYPALSIQRHLAAMVEVQRSRDAPWLVIEELSGFRGEQDFAPVYYRMREDLRFVRCRYDRLPAGSCLVEVPLLIDAGGRMDSSRVGAVRRELEGRGRTVKRALLWDPLRTASSDFHAYGNYLIVEPAPSGGPGD